YKFYIVNNKKKHSIMGLKKGQTGNPNGRRKGSQNKATKSLKATVNAFLNKNMEDLQKNYNEYEARDKLLFIEKQLKYAMPTQAAVKADVQHEVMGERIVIIGNRKYVGEAGVKQLADEINNS